MRVLFIAPTHGGSAGGSVRSTFGRGEGSDFTINGTVVPKERTRLRHSAADTRTPIALRERLGDRTFVVQLGLAQMPWPCLSSEPRKLAENIYLPAFDMRLDGEVFYGLFRRDQIVGIADWNARSAARP